MVSTSCEVHRGASGVLLVAPHGGRRPPVDAADPPPNLRVNDVYTPELTRRLGERLDASWIINEQLDRNVLDLNRTSQVLRRAGWFLDLLVAEIAAILARHGRAEVLFVHGWNVGQAKCDLGFGAVEKDGELVVADGARMTVGDVYRRDRIASLRAAAARVGIEMSIGAQYPASHPNNLLQLFTAHDRHVGVDSVRQLASWSGAGVLDALQLEFGIPLRWPGAWRQRLLDAFAATYVTPVRSRPDGGPVATSGTPARPVAAPAVASALQFYDPRAELGVLAGVGRMQSTTLGGRLLLFLGGRRVALFTGEDRLALQRGVAPLQVTDDGVESRVEFAGPILVMDDAATYLDLEAALASSRLTEARVDLHFRGAGGAALPLRFGAVQGTVSIDGECRQVATGAFANVAAGRLAGPAAQTTLTAAFPDASALLSRQAHDQPSASAWRFTGDGSEAAGDGEVLVELESGDRFTPQRFEWRPSRGSPVSGQPLSRMAILRGGPGGRYVRVTFGAARYERAGQSGFGLYEYAVPLPSAS